MFGTGRWDHGAQSFGPTLRLLADALSLPLDDVVASGEVAVASRPLDIAAGPHRRGHGRGPTHDVSGLRGGRPLLTFSATWYCGTDLEPTWDLRPTGWRIEVEGDAPLHVELPFPVPLERMGETTPGYTANRAVNAVPVVCAAAPGIRTTIDLPQVIALGWVTGEAPPRAHAGDQLVLGVGRRRAPPHPGVHRLRHARAPARADLPEVPQPGVAADRGVRTGPGRRPHRQRPPVVTRRSRRRT